MENEPLYTLKKYWGYDNFRNSQEAVIKSVLESNDTLALLPTGGGKSITFQVPTMMRKGICIVVSPLIALMTDQVEALKNREIRALSLAGGLPYPELERLLNNALYGQYKFLYLSPERLQQEVVRNYLKVMSINLIVIDEANCVSLWGKDFRPAYLQCKWLKEQFPNIPLLALTASATPQVQQDILHQLGIEKSNVISTSLARPNIAYKVYKVKSKFHHLLQLLRTTEGTVIIYLRSRNGCVQLAHLLESHDISATYFHGGLPAEEKNNKLSMWLLNDIRVMVATNAFGMGIDKPDVRWVIHWDIPQTLEDYFQEAGRAGRDGNPAEAIVFYNEVDIKNAEKLLNEYLIDIPYLKIVYSKLNSYFQIAIGEGTENTYSFLFPDFCKRYNLLPLKTYNALQVLDRFSIISFNHHFYNKVTFQMKASPEQLVKYITTHRYIKNITIYLMRCYELIFHFPVELEMAKLMERTEKSHKEIMGYLETLHNDGIGVLKCETADIQLIFNVPRDDDRTINSIGKHIKEYNHTKQLLQNKVYQYLEDESTCRSVFLLEYFGEKNGKNCGICSNCLTQTHSPKNDKQKIEADILQLLSYKPFNCNDLINTLPYSEQQINTVLDELFAMKKITFNIFNELCLK